MSRTRLDADVRKVQIINTGLTLAEKVGYEQVTINAIAKELKISHALVLYHFTTKDKLKSKILRSAIQFKKLQVIAQARAMRHPLTKTLSIELIESLKNWA